MTTCVSGGRLPILNPGSTACYPCNLPVFQFPHLQNENNNSVYTIGLLVGLNGLTKCLKHFWADHKVYINVTIIFIIFL